MPRYIDAEKLEKDGWSASRTYQQDVKTMVYETKKMTDFPTADVVERKKGHWINRSLNICYPEWERYTCSECGKHAYGYDFCPNCGADMRGDGNADQI